MFISQTIRVWRGINKLIVRCLPPAVLGFQVPFDMVEWEILGNGDGAWAIPKGWLESTSVCYLFGVGVDVSFDLHLQKKYKCSIFSFDPTPSSINFIESLGQFPGRFLPWGVWKRDGTLTLFPQIKGDDVNLSALHPKRGDALCNVPCYRLQTIMDKLGHERIDLLKIDIEGAWLGVLEDMAASSIAPTILCIEFDSPTSLRRIRRAAQALKSMGMLHICRHRDNYLFVNADAYEARAYSGAT